jgi:putative transposase
MSRRTRLRLAELPLHLIQRGNNRGACFFSDDDYRVYLYYLGLLSAQFSCAVHAYVLMPNHVHLLLSPQEAEAPSLLMKHLGQRYVQYINRTHQRSGTLWEGRFRSSPVQTELYMLRCYRYIEMNPVRAGMVSHPTDYRWSSFGANAQGKTNALIAPHATYLSLDADAAKRRTSYMDLFRAELAAPELAEIRAAVNTGYALGSEQFQKEVGRMTGRRAGRGKKGRPVSDPKFAAARQDALF